MWIWVESFWVFHSKSEPFKRTNASAAIPATAPIVRRTLMRRFDMRYLRLIAGFLFFQIIEVIAHGPLVRAWNLILVQRALSIALGGNHRLLISHTARA